MEKNINVNGHSVKIKIIDKKLRNTLVCIHGFSSNRWFIGELDQHIDNFNIVSISYEKISKLNIETINNVIKKIFNKHLKHTKLYVLGHSLGGFFASEVSTSKKIKGVYLLNPIHPFLWKTKGFNTLKKIIQPKSQLAKSSANLLIKSLKSKGSKLVKFIDSESFWFVSIADLVKNGERIQKKLFENYKSIRNKTIFIVSKKDNIISSTKLIEFLEENNFKYYKIDYDGHSPLIEKSYLIAPYLLNVERKKRWFFKNIVVG